MSVTLSAKDKVSARLFKAVHSRNLIYNTCWEDPRLDRVALDLQPHDRVLVITSAGCNALDYLLAGAGEVNAVDMNPIQNALLELKVAGIRQLDHAAFFKLFGRGCCDRAKELYCDALRDELLPFARRYWDRHISMFEGGGWRQSFYYRGTSGLLAKLVLTNAQTFKRLRRPIEELLAARSVDEQRQLYETRIRDALWSPALRWFLSRTATMSLMGVPAAQRQQIVAQYPGGVGSFIRDRFETVITRLPFADNYFWRVYLQGGYTPECCPEYLKPENFQRLKDGLLDRLHIRTSSVTNFLRQAPPGISKFVLLDHMDWMSSRHPEALREEWHALLDNARPASRVIFRSAGLNADFVDAIRVRRQGRDMELGRLLRYDRPLAAALHVRDRVHTYGSFHIADLLEAGD
ncbi:MAG: BtaA family protein [Planctomycetia bacterium]|nr:BtaA family protein [Planctomycetia bacterium]